MSPEEAMRKIRAEVKEETRSKSPFAEAWAGGAGYVLTRMRELAWPTADVGALDSAHDQHFLNGYTVGYEAGRSDRKRLGGCDEPARGAEGDAPAPD